MFIHKQISYIAPLSERRYNKHDRLHPYRRRGRLYKRSMKSESQKRKVQRMKIQFNRQKPAAPGPARLRSLRPRLAAAVILLALSAGRGTEYRTDRSTECRAYRSAGRGVLAFMHPSRRGYPGISLYHMLRDQLPQKILFRGGGDRHIPVHGTGAEGCLPVADGRSECPFQ